MGLVLGTTRLNVDVINVESGNDYHGLLIETLKVRVLPVAPLIRNNTMKEDKPKWYHWLFFVLLMVPNPIGIVLWLVYLSGMGAGMGAIVENYKRDKS